MDSFELNKIIAAVLMVALLVIGIGKLSKIVFHVEKPKVPGYVVEVDEVVAFQRGQKCGTLDGVGRHHLYEASGQGQG